MAALDSQLAVARARLEDAGAEASSLSQVRVDTCTRCCKLKADMQTRRVVGSAQQVSAGCLPCMTSMHNTLTNNTYQLQCPMCAQRLALERNRVAELEGLLAGMRAREYKQVGRDIMLMPACNQPSSLVKRADNGPASICLETCAVCLLGHASRLEPITLWQMCTLQCLLNACPY